MPLIAHFAKKGISRFADKIIHSNTKYLGVWGQSYIVVIDRSFQHGKGKSAWEFSLLKSFLCWLLCLWLSPWRKASQSGKTHCPVSLITVIQPTRAECTGDHTVTSRSPSLQFQPRIGLTDWAVIRASFSCPLWDPHPDWGPLHTCVHLLRPLPVIWVDGGWPQG